MQNNENDLQDFDSIPEFLEGVTKMCLSQKIFVHTPFFCLMIAFFAL